MGYSLLIGGTVADPAFAFAESDIVMRSLSLTTAVDLVSDELTKDVMSIEVLYNSLTPVLFSPADYDGIMTDDGYLFGTADLTSDITAIAFGTPVWLFNDETLVAKMYTQNVERTGPNKYRLNTMSIIGLLEYKKHLGGVYINAPVSSVLAEIIGDAFSYQVDAAVADLIVSGWLPIDTARRNLHKLMFALGFNLVKDSNGETHFTFLTTSAKYDIPDSRVFYGGQTSFDKAITAAEVTEHSYSALVTDASEILFDNTGLESVSSIMLEFKDPYHDYVTTGTLQVESSGDNWAVVTGLGTLSGKKYTHNTTVVRADSGNQGEENVVSSEDDTLVNALNAINVARRLVAYGSKIDVSAELKILSEKCGDYVRLSDVFGDVREGFITSMEINISSFLKASANLVTNYTPTGQGNYYSNRVLIDASGNWTVPAGVAKIRLVVVGGGSGGQGGYKGEDGDWEDYRRYTALEDEYDDAQYPSLWIRHTWIWAHNLAKAAAGGNGGAAGSPGKVLVGDYAVQPGDVLTISVGAGGAGGARQGGAGAAGTDTTVSSTNIDASSSQGTQGAGFVDPFTGDTYGALGLAGEKGGDGGIARGNENGLEKKSYNGRAGGSVSNAVGGEGAFGVSGTYIGGTDDYPYVRPWDSHLSAYPKPFQYYLDGGGGGGAAYGKKGSPATAPSFAFENMAHPIPGYNEKRNTLTIVASHGGNGADAADPPIAGYGCGGNGGGGGGGGGATAGYSIDVFYEGETEWYDTTPSQDESLKSSGGRGAKGGAGGSGCVLILY